MSANVNKYAEALPLIRSSLGSLQKPRPSDRVATECCYSADTAFTPGEMVKSEDQLLPTGGVFINLQKFTACSPRFLALDRARTGSSLYLHSRYERLPREDAPASSEGDGAPTSKPVPTKLALGVLGGFDLQAPPPFTVSKFHSLVVFSGPPGGVDWGVALARAHVDDSGTLSSLMSTSHFYLFPDYPSPAHSSLPEFLAGVVAAVLAHEEKNTSAAASATTAGWEEQVLPSPYAPLLVPRPDPSTGLPR